ncbi:DUF927 domain-containing protein [Methylosinus sporium]|uniref:DUF927 domain-containing protein n=1 Tax=Methylosinus sporium TaxID=428 RepID=UPI00163D7D63|nr:DUF927 domain-containing protein [Methylosinus sporium]
MDSEWKHPHKGHIGWVPQRVTWRELINYFDDPYVSPNKNGHMIMFGEVAPAAGKTTIARKKASVKRLNAVVLDLDAGQPEEEIFPPLLKSGLNFVYYTSHSNSKTRTKIDLKALREYVKSPNGVPYNPSLADVKRYLANELKLHPMIVESASIVKVDTIGAFDDKPTKDPLQVELAHSPIHKCRIILPLATEYVIPDEPDEAFAAMNDFKAIVDHLAGELGFWFDSTSGQVGRAFYGARCKSYDRYRAVVGGSSLLVLPACTDEMREAAGFKNQEKRKKALAERQARRSDKQLDGIPDTTKFMRRHADDFDGIGWLNAIDWETRGEVREGKVSIRCPNETQHSDYPNVNDAGCVAINPGSHYKNGAFLITCQHAHCRHFETRDFLTMVCEEVIEATVDSDLPALENFVTEESESSTSAGGKPNRAKLKKLLGKKPFAVNEYDWIEYDEIQKNGKDVKTYPVCRAFDVLDMARDESGEGWSLRIKFDDFDGREHVARIALSDIHKSNSDLRPRLANMGLDIHPLGKGFNALFARLVSVKERSIIVRKPGWRPGRKKFVTPAGVMIGVEDGEGVYLENAFTDQTAGNLDGQLAAWGIALHHGGAHHFIGCLAGVAGALVQFINLGSTPIIALTGTSSHGKTTSMMLAAGGFGYPDILPKGKESRGSLLHSLRSTENAVEYLAERSNGTFCGLDETALFDLKRLESLIFMLASGSGKNRMRTDATERETKSWESFGMISSEHPVAKSVETASGEQARVGFSMRVADINIDGYRPIPEADYIKMRRLLLANYGHVGPAFVKALVESGTRPETIREAIDVKVSALAGEGASPLVQRSAGVFGVLWQVGEMLGKARLLPAAIGDGEIERRIHEIWKRYLASEIAEVLDPVAMAVETLREALYSRIGVDVHSTTENEGRKGRATIAWYVKPDDNTDDAFADVPMLFFVKTGELARLAGGTIDSGALKAELVKRGILKRDSDGKFSHRKVPDVGAVRNYPLNFSATLGDGD